MAREILFVGFPAFLLYTNTIISKKDFLYWIRYWKRKKRIYKREVWFYWLIAILYVTSTLLQWSIEVTSTKIKSKNKLNYSYLIY